MTTSKPILWNDLPDNTLIRYKKRYLVFNRDVYSLGYPVPQNIHSVSTPFSEEEDKPIYNYCPKWLVLNKNLEETTDEV